MSDASVRLPTRCPACKGGVIERMARSSHGSFIWYHCLFCNHYWRFRLDDAPATVDVEVTGSLFIVSRGRKYRFEFVPVYVITEEALRKHLESKTRHGEVENRKLQRDIDRLTSMLGIAEAEEARLWKIVQADEGNPRKSDAWRFVYNKTKTLTQQIEDLRVRQKTLTSGEYFFDGLPSGISTAKTDADGRFTLAIPSQGRYGVVARASRDLLKGKETYFWFVWVTLDGQSPKRLRLSNDNVMGAGSPDSALR